MFHPPRLILLRLFSALASVGLAWQIVLGGMLRADGPPASEQPFVLEGAEPSDQRSSALMLDRTLLRTELAGPSIWWQ